MMTSWLDIKILNEQAKKLDNLSLNLDHKNLFNPLMHNVPK